MHRPSDRQALARRLLGTGKEPGPLDAGWVKRQFGITGTALMNWRKRGIPRDRVDEVMEVLAAVLPADTKNAPPAGADGAMGAFLTRWYSDDPPPWADLLTTQIIDAVRQLRDRTREETVQTVLDRVDQLGLVKRPRAAKGAGNRNR